MSRRATLLAMRFLIWCDSAVVAHGRVTARLLMVVLLVPAVCAGAIVRTAESLGLPMDTLWTEAMGL